ncbi:NADP-dependent isocitrate dehydrogenase [Promethearchaeum syntrophicum]|uniref:NADP-dependent isocitrate dehydrogenase n=1 Tax=Promethearchaeum syntrophicum TaxID=2594042 RepID=A0A5B9DCA1_9ARCH|nr:NADP-dependent isocitrate dehydrogenase [Candidatus Prometheoarchaeum syntrophicum]QEE16635.1 Monomeric isocitrate dehydrogenase [Candidatus Prometheoarchaeum syntrophicum]
MNQSNEKILYTITDEAPRLATYSLLPIVKKFAEAADVVVDTKDISLASRIIANFPDYLTEEQRLPYDLGELGKLVHKPEANIIKLPNISASIPQIKAAVKELQEKGYNIPNFPEKPQTDEEKRIRAAFNIVKGSAANPVLRMGNADRRVPIPVKNYAKSHPHSMGEWTKESKSHVATMNSGDLLHNEIATTITDQTAGNSTIEFVDTSGKKTILKEKLALIPGEIIDASVMSKKALRAFLEEEVKDAKAKDVLFSVHLKATMMKVSDPIIFGHVVSVYFKEVFTKYAETFEQLGINSNNGLAELYTKIKELPPEKQKEITDDINTCYENNPKLAMVDSDNGITNLHVPSKVIIDASMPAAIRMGGKMWGSDGKAYDTKFVIPDSTYAGVFQTTIDYCKEHGAYNPSTMGTVQNIGLMAEKAEEYGSHDKTFEIHGEGIVRVVSETNEILLERPVEDGDFFRMCQAKDLPIQDWVKLAVTRAKATSYPTVFWLDEKRAHDAELIKKIKVYLKDYDTSGLDIKIMNLEKATQNACELIHQGKDTIAVSGNVLRDYLTDLFPILEVGTSAKMLSIVPLMQGGGLFETGAGGSAPKHVQQFIQENHLRWDSLGAFMAIPISLTHFGERMKNQKALILAETLNKAIEQYLDNNKSPSRKVKELDNRGSHFYLAMYWAQALAAQTKDAEMKERFAKLATVLAENELKITNELLAVQGHPVDLHGYYKPDDELATKAMRPSETFNNALNAL